ILLPAISKDTGTSTATLQWAVTGYSLVGAAVVVTAGVLGDIAGRRRIFIAGLWVFVASCAFIALSRNGAGIISGPAIQGAAGSTLLACGLSLPSVSATGGTRSSLLMTLVCLFGVAIAVQYARFRPRRAQAVDRAAAAAAVAHTMPGSASAED